MKYLRIFVLEVLYPVLRDGESVKVRAGEVAPVAEAGEAFLNNAFKSGNLKGSRL